MSTAETAGVVPVADTAMRLDRWLWCARFFKSRTQSAKLCAGSRVRRNRRVLTKASATVRIGDVLTFPQGEQVRVVRVRALPSRRGPAAEALMLFEDLAPAVPAVPAAAALGRTAGSGRPTKADRRAFERLRETEG